MADMFVEYIAIGKDKYKIVRHMPSETGPRGRTLCGRDIPADARYSKSRYQQVSQFRNCEACNALAPGSLDVLPPSSR